MKCFSLLFLNDFRLTFPLIMKWKHLKLTLLILCLLVGVVACHKEKNRPPASPIDQLQQKLNTKTIEIINQPETAYIYDVTPDFSNPRGYVSASSRRNLSPSQIKELSSLILADKHYLLDRTKSCLFIPTYAYLFAKGSDEIIILISPSCKQMKIIQQGQEPVYLDNDPIFYAFEIFYKSVK